MNSRAEQDFDGTDVLELDDGQTWPAAPWP